MVTKQPTMPTFAFFRRRDIEREVGLILAGNLVVDIPKSRKSPLPHEQRMIAKIIQKLTDGARSGEMLARRMSPGGRFDRR